MSPLSTPARMHTTPLAGRMPLCAGAIATATTIITTGTTGTGRSIVRR